MLKELYSRFPFKTDRKIVVFEVDDFGAIRMPSKEIYDKLVARGFNLSDNRYNRYDTLLSENDLYNLFEVLTSVKDKNSKPAVFSPVAVVTNPDFKKIRESDFSTYFFETIPETFNRHFGNNNVWNIWEQGIEANIFLPQFHGREHLNVARWMRALQLNHGDTTLAFNFGFYGLPARYTLNGQGYMDTYAYLNPAERARIIPNLKEGLEIFAKLFGYTALLFTPPNAIFDPLLEPDLRHTQLKFITRPKLRMVNRGNGQRIPVIGFMGRKGLFGMRYSVRTCSFEPCNPDRNDAVDQCLSQIQKSFNDKQPAIISSHRVNFAGNIDSKNGDNGLKQLKTLLKQVTLRWPDTEFMSSMLLYNMILKDSNEE